MKKIMPIALVLFVFLFSSCTFESGIPSSFLASSSNDGNIPSQKEVSSSSTISQLLPQSSELQPPDGQNDSLGNIERPFYVGMFEYIVAVPSDIDPSIWMPIVHILMLKDDGSALYFQHFPHGEWLNRFEGRYEVTDFISKEECVITFTLSRTGIDGNETPADMPKQSVLTFLLDGPPSDRIRVTLNSGDSLFDDQREGWPNWFVKIEPGEYGSMALNDIR